MRPDFAGIMIVFSLLAFAVGAILGSELQKQTHREWAISIGAASYVVDPKIGDVVFQYKDPCGFTFRSGGE